MNRDRIVLGRLHGLRERRPLPGAPPRAGGFGDPGGYNRFPDQSTGPAFQTHLPYPQYPVDWQRLQAQTTLAPPGYYPHGYPPPPAPMGAYIHPGAALPMQVGGFGPQYTTIGAIPVPVDQSGLMVSHQVDIAPATEKKLERLIEKLKGKGTLLIIMLIAGLAGGFAIAKIIEAINKQDKKGA